MKTDRENGNVRVEAHFVTILLITNSACTTLELNPAPLGKKPASSLLSYNTDLTLHGSKWSRCACAATSPRKVRWPMFTEQTAGWTPELSCRDGRHYIPCILIHVLS